MQRYYFSLNTPNSSQYFYHLLYKGIFLPLNILHNSQKWLFHASLLLWNISSVFRFKYN
ncbi:hypothetical protein EV202_12316 [Bacteroides heparinolyticus]|uniref:Uncharacterized protein n=1 Tax=Prevotella heparinolytica TaxID=28113 RepID=A0A4R2LTC0_9BACE|nr:hypothetical protein EV202_12316 [Bacteroides heparinolyticus]